MKKNIKNSFDYSFKKTTAKQILSNKKKRPVETIDNESKRFKLNNFIENTGLPPEPIKTEPLQTTFDYNSFFSNLEPISPDPIKMEPTDDYDFKSDDDSKTKIEENGKNPNDVLSAYKKAKKYPPSLINNLKDLESYIESNNKCSLDNLCGKIGIPTECSKIKEFLTAINYKYILMSDNNGLIVKLADKTDYYKIYTYCLTINYFIKNNIDMIYFIKYTHGSIIVRLAFSTFKKTWIKSCVLDKNCPSRIKNGVLKKWYISIVACINENSHCIYGNDYDLLLESCSFQHFLTPSKIPEELNYCLLDNIMFIEIDVAWEKHKQNKSVDDYIKEYESFIIVYLNNSILNNIHLNFVNYINCIKNNNGFFYAS